MENKKLERASKKENKVIGGVAYGLAQYFNMEPKLMRVLFAVLTLIGGGGLLAYVILYFVMPQSSEF